MRLATFSDAEDEDHVQDHVQDLVQDHVQDHFEDQVEDQVEDQREDQVHVNDNVDGRDADGDEADDEAAAEGFDDDATTSSGQRHRAELAPAPVRNYGLGSRPNLPTLDDFSDSDSDGDEQGFHSVVDMTNVNSDENSPAVSTGSSDSGVAATSRPKPKRVYNRKPKQKDPNFVQRVSPRKNKGQRPVYLSDFVLY